MATTFIEKRIFFIPLVLYIFISSVRGTTTITTSCTGLVSETLNITCTIDPHNSVTSITLPDGTTNAAVCSAPIPNTDCTPIVPYTTDYTKIGTKITVVLNIPSLDITTHNGTWTCTHGLESSTGEVCVNAPLSSQGKEPIFMASSTSALSISLSGKVYCQHPVSAVTFEVLYAEQNGAYTTFNPQPFFSIQNLGSNGCGSHESNVSFSGILSCDNYTLAGKTFTLMARFNQSNLPPDSNTYNITSSGNFSCPDVETTTTMNPPDKGLSTGGVIGIVIGVLIFIIIVVVVVCICKHIKKVSVEDKTSSNMFRESSVITQAQQSWPRKLPSIEHKNPSKGKKVKKDKVKPKPADDNNDKTKKPPKKSETHQTTQNDNNHDQTEKTKGKSETNQPIENDKNHDKTENSKGKSETNQPIQNDINHDKTENTKGKSETNQPSQNDNNHDKTENAKGKSETNQPIQNDNNQDKTENTKGKSETNQPIQNDNNHDKTENTKGKSETNQPIQNDNNQDKTANTQGKSETHQPHQNDKNHNKTMKPKEKSETH